MDRAFELGESPPLRHANRNGVNMTNKIT
jgi:hypothetical protein